MLLAAWMLTLLCGVLTLCRASCRCCLDAVTPGSPKCTGYKACTGNEYAGFFSRATCKDLCSPAANKIRFVKFRFKAEDTTKTIVELAVATPTLSTLVKAVTAAGLVKELSGAGPITVFAPTDKAFEKVANLKDILADKRLLLQVLQMHLMVGKLVKSGKLVEGMQVGDLKFNKVASGWKITAPGSSAMITAADIGATNGVVHLIDTVLLPAGSPTQDLVQVAASTPTLSTLVSAVKAPTSAPRCKAKALHAAGTGQRRV